MLQKEIQSRVATIYDGHPKQIAAVRQNAIRKTRQVIDEGFGFSLLLAFQPDAADAVGARLVHQHERLIRTDGDAVREIKIAQHDARLLRLRIVSEEASVRSMLEHVGFQFGEWKLVRSIGEIDRAVGGNVEIVCALERDAVSLVG